MRDFRFLLKPRYITSRALIIGIDKYQNVSPLSYAVSDASAVRDLLIQELGFDDKNVIFLKDGDASHRAILKAYLNLTSDEVELDDRIIVFFAGHGCTRLGNRGEVGYLVPYDADENDPSTLIRWDDLTRNAEIIRAKHMLFIMDACYGGLALSRQLQTGSVRFLRDMLLRYSRQVLTAGKADEEVSDSGGPIPMHSVFTGHLIQGLRGAAASERGVLTANGLMAYVCRMVANDQNSHQTPHYGYFDGDGDFIISAPNLFSSDEQLAEEKKEIDEFYELELPIVLQEPSESIDSKVRKIKRMLADHSATIEVHDLLVQEVKNFLAQTGEDNFALSGQVSVEELQERMTKYERISSDLCDLLACVAYWAQEPHRVTLRKAFSRLTDRLEPKSGLTAWLNLRWYPVILALYSAGIAAVEGERYDSLANILYAPSLSPEVGEKYHTTALSTVYATLELNRMNLFKMLPGHERLYTPLSEYLHKLLQPRLDDILFLGSDYERVFDEFEVLLAIVIACESKARGNVHIWGPVGRFGWKFHRSSGENNPLLRVVEKARKEGDDWAPVKAGVFGSLSTPAVLDVAEEYTKGIAALTWF